MSKIEYQIVIMSALLGHVHDLLGREEIGSIAACFGQQELLKVSDMRSQ
jgi:hypothetical protein